MTSSPSRFSTLMLREWMQHKRGWLITLLLPPLLFLALLPIGETRGIPVDKHPLVAGLLILGISTLAVFAITWLSAMFQLSGLARRDVQDRSIEFWLSLPASHTESIGATLLSHALLMPLAGVLVGFAFGGVIGSGLIIKQAGFAGWSSVPWVSVFAIGSPLLLRALFGVVLLSLWLLPLMMMIMVASAWLKRWGIPAVALTLGVGGAILKEGYGITFVFDLLEAQFDGAARALVADPELLGSKLQTLERPGGMFSPSAWALGDALSALQHLVSPHLIGGLIIAAGCFALLVWKRSRNA